MINPPWGVEKVRLLIRVPDVILKIILLTRKAGGLIDICIGIIISINIMKNMLLKIDYGVKSTSDYCYLLTNVHKRHIRKLLPLLIQAIVKKRSCRMKWMFWRSLFYPWTNIFFQKVEQQWRLFWFYILKPTKLAKNNIWFKCIVLYSQCLLFWDIFFCGISVQLAI